MAKKNKNQNNNDPTTFSPKWAKIIKEMPEFRDLADAASEQELKDIILTCESNMYTITKEIESDEKLTAAKELVKDFTAPYREAMRAQDAKVQYALFLLDGKGINLSDREYPE